MFLLGFFSGLVFMVAVMTGLFYMGKKRRADTAEETRIKDELLWKALPVYTQAQRIFKQDVIEPQKIASLMFIANVIENSLEAEFEKIDPNVKIQ